MDRHCLNDHRKKHAHADYHNIHIEFIHRGQTSLMRRLLIDPISFQHATMIILEQTIRPQLLDAITNEYCSGSVIMTYY